MRYLLLLVALLQLGAARGSTCTTVASGTFTDQNVWDCGCDPITCDTLIIAHALTLLEDLEWSGGLFHITPAGSLNSTHQFTWTCEVMNQGWIDVRRFQTYPGHDTRNLGTINCEVFVSVSDSTFNEGDISASDSLVMGWYRPMVNEGTMTTNVLYNLGALNNLGVIASMSCSTLPFFNAGLFTVENTLYCAGSFWNEAEIITGDLTVLSGLENYGEITVLGQFLNGIDSIGPADTRLQANSTIHTRDFINSAGSEIRGPGQLCIEGHAENHGVLRGSLVICDLSPTMDVPPYLDVNTGSFWMSVNYCANSSCTWTSMSDEASVPTIQISPNPAVDLLHIQLGSSSPEVDRIEVRDLGGRLVQQLTGPFAERIVLHRNGLVAGTYLLRVLPTSGGSMATQLVVFTD